MHTKNCLERQGLVQKASHAFFGNTSVHQNIVKNISLIFNDLQKLPISKYYSVIKAIAHPIKSALVKEQLLLHQSLNSLPHKVSKH